MSAEITLRRYTFALYPTSSQDEALHTMRRAHAALWNAVHEISETYFRRVGAQEMLKPKKERGKTRPSAYDLSAQIRDLKRECPEFNIYGSASLMQTIRRYEKAWAAWGRRSNEWKLSREGRPPQQPQFRSSDNYPGCDFCYSTKSGNRRMPNGFEVMFGVAKAGDLRRRPRHGKVRMKGVPGWVKMRGRLPHADHKIRTGTLTWTGEDWELSIVVDVEAPQTAGSIDATVTLDLIESFARVDRADGARGAGPESVFVTDKGRIVSSFQGVSATSASETSESGFDHGLRDHRPEGLDASETSESGFDHGGSRQGVGEVVASETSESGFDHGRRAIRSGGETASETSESGFDHGVTPHTTLAASETSESGFDHGRPEAREASETSEPGFDHGVGFEHLLNGAASETSESGFDHGVEPLDDPTQLASETSESGFDHGVEHRPAAAKMASEVRIKYLQRRMSGCKKGSCKYRHYRRLKSRLEKRVARRRHEALHVITSRWASEFKSMTLVRPSSLKWATKTGKGTSKRPGLLVGVKAYLNRHVLRQAPALAIAMLEYKMGDRLHVVVDQDSPSMVGGEMIKAARAVRRVKRRIRDHGQEVSQGL